ncbi:hypothetical protein [Methylobacterium goesingense]|uniref:Uncharacterized protein n=1 Tax=Methylobacterium goesingense TaxID=243690 RepID=A0ABV2L9W9_9HYPH|nr:hypothetical protein [Methylobacterium goesingense]
MPYTRTFTSKASETLCIDVCYPIPEAFGHQIEMPIEFGDAPGISRPPPSVRSLQAADIPAQPGSQDNIFNVNLISIIGKNTANITDNEEIFDMNY